MNGKRVGVVLFGNIEVLLIAETIDAVVITGGWR